MSERSKVAASRCDMDCGRVDIYEEFPTRADCTVCRHCKEQAAEAGQLERAHYVSRRAVTPKYCEQCGSYLVQGEIFHVVLEF